jgi:UPF0755 protein
MAALGLLLLGGVGFEWYARRPGRPADEWLEVGWPEGLSAADAAGLLCDLGLSSERTGLTVYFVATRASSCFRPGAHVLPKHASPRLLRQLLCAEPDRPSAKLTVPEGFTRFAVAERLGRLGICSAQGFVLASADPELLRPLGIEPAAFAPASTAEGYLFPATYAFPLDSEPAAVLRRMVEESDRRWRGLAAARAEGVERLRTTLQLGRREVLTLASLVEKEAAVADERPIIAGVFLNRLRSPAFTPRYLQSDPTAVYGCYAMPDDIPACRGFTGRASPALNDDPANRYSTYVHTGLPPGPIANPGAAAIEAVLNPADVPYLYFVAAGGGRHTFSVDYAQHLQAVERLRQRQK